MGIHSKPVVNLILMLVLSFASNIRAQNVEDDAHFFSADCVASADKSISEIDSTSRLKTILITFPEIPADRQDQFKQQGKEAFYNAWAMELMRTKKVDVVILMTKSPRRLQIATSSQCEKHLMTPDQRNQMRDAMLKEFRTDHFDEGLTAGLSILGGYAKSSR